MSADQQPDNDARFMRRQKVITCGHQALEALAVSDHTPETMADELGWRVSTARLHLEALARDGMARFVGGRDIPLLHAQGRINAPDVLWEWYAIVPENAQRVLP